MSLNTKEITPPAGARAARVWYHMAPPHRAGAKFGCGNTDGYLNVGPDHWFVCHRHKTKWRAGSSLFSEWRDENEDTRLRNIFRLCWYMTVKPVMPLR